MISDMPSGYDPNSTDAMFARILQRLEAQDKLLEQIASGVAKTNGRVTALERWRDVLTAKVAMVSGCVSAAVAAGAWIIKLWRES